MHSEVGSDADYRRGTIKLRTLETIPWRISGAADTGVRRVRISRVVDAGAASGVDATKNFSFAGVSWEKGRARRIFDGWLKSAAPNCLRSLSSIEPGARGPLPG